MDAKIDPLPPDETAKFDDARRWLKGYATDDPEKMYAEPAGKLALLEVIICDQLATDTDKVNSVGVGFGDALAQELGMEWVMFEDELGRRPSLNFPGTMLTAHPLDAIARRFEDNDDIDIVLLFVRFCQRLRDLKANGPPER